MEVAIELALSHNFDTIIHSLSCAKEYMAKQWGELRMEKEALLREKQEIRREKDLVEKEKARMRAERLTFEKEKLMLQSKHLLKDTRQVLKLNVGGHTVTTSTTTLRSIKGTMLDAMFSGRHELCTDQEGRVFIDRDFKYFRLHLPDDRIDRERVLEEFDYFCVPIEEQFPQADFLTKQLVNTQTLTADSWVLCLTVVDDVIFSGHRDGTVCVWDMNTGTCVRKLQQPKILPRNDRETNEGIERIEVVDNIVLGGGKLLTLWDMDSGEIRGWITPKDVLIGFKVFGGKIFSMWEDGGVRVYDLTTLRQEKKWDIPGCWVNCKDGLGSQIVTESIDGFSFALWDLLKREKIATFRGHSEEVSAIHVRQNLNQLVSGSYDKTIKVWDVTSGECISTFHGHIRSVRALDVIGNVLVSGSHDKTIKIWNLENGKVVTTLMGHTNTVSCLEIVGNMIVTGSWDNTIKIWNVDMDYNLVPVPPPPPQCDDSFLVPHFTGTESLLSSSMSETPLGSPYDSTENSPLGSLHNSPGSSPQASPYVSAGNSPIVTVSPRTSSGGLLKPSYGPSDCSLSYAPRVTYHDEFEETGIEKERTRRNSWSFDDNYNYYYNYYKKTIHDHASQQAQSPCDALEGLGGLFGPPREVEDNSLSSKSLDSGLRRSRSRLVAPYLTSGKDKKRRKRRKDRRGEVTSDVTATQHDVRNTEVEEKVTRNGEETVEEKVGETSEEDERKMG